MIIPRIDKLDESLALAHEYGFGFEFNDFYSPKVLDDTELTESIIEKYKAAGLPDYCTSHGDFFDVLVFSEDKYIREISRKRIIQSLETALKRRGVSHKPQPLFYSRCLCEQLAQV